jgi:hypothetical protein
MQHGCVHPPKQRKIRLLSNSSISCRSLRMAQSTWSSKAKQLLEGIDGRPLRT